MSGPRPRLRHQNRSEHRHSKAMFLPIPSLFPWLNPPIPNSQHTNTHRHISVLVMTISVHHMSKDIKTAFLEMLHPEHQHQHQQQGESSFTGQCVYASNTLLWYRLKLVPGRYCLRENTSTACILL